MGTCKTAKIWHECDKGVKFDSAAHKLKVMECFLDELYSEKGLALGGDEYVPQYPHSVIVDCIQEFVMPGLNKLIKQESAPVDTSEVGIRIRELGDVVNLMGDEFDEMLGMYRKLSTRETELHLNGKKVHYGLIETLTRELAETLMPRMAERIKGKLTEMLDCAIDERNGDIGDDGEPIPF